MIITLTDKESSAFYNFIDSEVRCVVNQWDPDIGRCPSQKRLKAAKYGLSILNKWRKTQPAIYENIIDLDNIVACSLDLASEEVAYSKNLLEQGIKSLRKSLLNAPVPYTGIYLVCDEEATIAENILSYFTEKIE